MQYFTAEQLQATLDFPSLIEALRIAFQADYQVPLRHHHNYKNTTATQDSTLLLMPAWEEGGYLGVKLVTVSPENSQYRLPSIQGIYTLFDTKNGQPIVQMDAKMLTVLRTAAASALAAQFLSHPSSKTLLMIGTGVLAPYLIRAHASIRPIEKVYIWGRRKTQAERVAALFEKEPLEVVAIDTIEEHFVEADIISCATLSATPLVSGKWLRAGQHLDLVGSYQPHTREADDECVRRASVFVDTLEGASQESGDIVLPLRDKVIQTTDILADLFDLCRHQHQGRKSEKEITLFKSVGHALEDLAAAKLVLNSLTKEF